MAKKKKIKREVNADNKFEKDTVVFMTAYDIHKIKHHFFRFRKKAKKKELWTQFHMAGFSHNNTYITPYAKCRYMAEYNSLNQITAFHFEDDFEKYNKFYDNFSNEMMTTLCFQHSAKALLDSTLIQVDTCFNMERFLVMFDDKVFQVDPLAFIMSGSLIVCFELIDFETGVPLKYDSIYGRSRNYGIKPIKKIKYFTESEFSEDNRKVCDIIFQDVYGFLTKSSRDKWEIGNYSYVHNILVVSNNIESVSKYFQLVLGGKIEDFDIKNISATDAFKYYSTEFLGVTTNIMSEENKHHILNDCMMLEAFKTFILLKMIVDYEIHQNIDKIVDHQIYAQSQLHPLHVPIITLNVIDNLKQTYSYDRYKQAIEFKLQALKIYRERKIDKNGRLLNILLYLLAMIGSAQTLQVLQTEFGLPFKIMFWITMGLFVFFGLIWIVREITKK